MLTVGKGVLNVPREWNETTTRDSLKKWIALPARACKAAPRNATIMAAIKLIMRSRQYTRGNKNLDYSVSMYVPVQLDVV